MKTNISTSIDTGRLGEAISRPGIDPRCWICLAVVEDIAIDPDEGVFVDLLTMPWREEITARLSSPYVASGSGMYFPIKVGDEVLVALPDGSPMQGACVIGRLFSPADPPSLQFAKDPATVNADIPETLSMTDDVVLVVEKNQSFRIQVQNDTTANEFIFNGDEFRVTLNGDASATIKANDNAKIYLGDDSTNTQPLVLGDELSDYFGAPGNPIPGRGGLLGFIARMATTLGYVVEPVPSFPSSVSATKVEGK